MDMQEDGLMETIEPAFAEYERLKIQERVQRGMRGKVESGKILGIGDIAPYGYAYSGTKRDKMLVIVEHEAAIVRRIFTAYVAGVGVTTIQQQLTDERVPTPADTRKPVGRPKTRGFGEWGRTTIHAMLRSEV
jgi:site-specific DNA recombinase